MSENLFEEIMAETFLKLAQDIDFQWKPIEFQGQNETKRGEHFLGGTVDENPPTNAGNMSSIPGLGRFHMAWITKSVWDN